MAFQEFFCNSSGNNMNGGSEGTATTAIGAAQLTSTNGAWDAIAADTTVSTFTCSDSPTLTAGMVGMYASVFKDGDSAPTTNQYVNALIIAIDNSAKTVTLSIAKRNTLGSAIADQANGYTIKIGGAWAGPGAAVTFPIGFISAAAVGPSAQIPRLNLNGTFTMSGTLTQNQAGPLVFRGYGTTAGDGTRCVIDANGGNFQILTLSGASCWYEDIEAKNNATGSVDGLGNTGVECLFRRIIVRDVRLSAFNTTGNGCILIECEAYNFNTSNTSGGRSGFICSGIATSAIRCVAHSSSGSNCNGFTAGTSQAHLSECIAAALGGDGFVIAATAYNVVIRNCDAYKCANGFNFSASSGVTTIYVENCNASRGSAAGLLFGAATFIGHIVNFGHYGNSSGLGTIPGSVVETGTVVYAANTDPWTDPENGDFRISYATAKQGGRGAFLITKSGYGASGATVGYNDIGAARHADPAAADVRYGVTTGANAGLLEIPNSGTPTGTQDATSDACVVSGKKYGSPQRTGSASAGSGGAPSIIGA